MEHDLIFCWQCKKWHRIQKTSAGWCDGDGILGIATETDFCSKAKRRGGVDNECDNKKENS